MHSGASRWCPGRARFPGAASEMPGLWAALEGDSRCVLKGAQERMGVARAVVTYAVSQRRSCPWLAHFPDIHQVDWFLCCLPRVS